MSVDEQRLLAAQARLDALRAKAARERAPATPAPLVTSLAAEIEQMRVASAAQLEAERQAHAQTAERVRAQALAPEAIAAWLARAGVGRRHSELAIDPKLVPAALRRRQLPDPQGGGAILAGRVGAGKTTAAIWAMRQLYRAGRAEPGGWRCASAAFITAGGLFARVFAKQPLAHFERVDLLVIDDWGRAYETDWPMAIVDELIDRRWSDLRSTILTANLAPEELQERYPQIFSRLTGEPGPGLVELNRADLRRASASARPDRTHGRTAPAAAPKGDRS